MFEAVKKTILWNYGRNTWQWDLLCILIVIFIFATPKSWFEGKERNLRPEEFAVSANVVSTNKVFLGAEIFTPENPEKAEKRIVEITGIPTAKIVGWKPKNDAEGKLIGYEVEVR